MMASDRGAASTPLPPRHGGTRASHHSDLQIPPYARREHWGNPSHDVASYEGVDWKAECDLSTGRGEWTFRLPVSDRRVAPPGNRCFQLKRRLPSETQPVLPTLFVPGFPKAATTWLYECMRSAFVPERVCTRSPRKLTEMRYVSTAAWNKSNCRGRRYLLPGISCTLTGGCGHMKESFFYGAGYNPTFKGGLAAFHGPEASRPFLTASAHGNSCHIPLHCFMIPPHGATSDSARDVPLFPGEARRHVL